MITPKTIYNKVKAFLLPEEYVPAAALIDGSAYTTLYCIGIFHGFEHQWSSAISFCIGGALVFILALSRLVHHYRNASNKRDKIVKEAYDSATNIIKDTVKEFNKKSQEFEQRTELAAKTYKNPISKPN
jgi:hypothetical protein